MNRAEVYMHFDSTNPESYLLCAESYGLKILQEKKLSDWTTELVIYGLEENVTRFMHDEKCNELAPLKQMMEGIDIEDYVAWVNNEVEIIKQLKKFEDNY